MEDQNVIIVTSFAALAISLSLMLFRRQNNLCDVDGVTGGDVEFA